MLINNKLKQFFGGNWSADKWTKEHTEIGIMPDLDEVPHKKAKKGKHHKKEPYVYDGHLCPFCRKELRKIATDKKDAMTWIFEPREKCCRECQSWMVRECPACKRETWYNYTTKIYKHQANGCGFEGVKK